jgi:hypothetical protein
MLSAQDFAESQVPVGALREYSDILGGLTVGKQMSEPLYGAGTASSGDIFRAGISPYVQKGLTSGLEYGFNRLFNETTVPTTTYNTGTGATVTSAPLPKL